MARMDHIYISHDGMKRDSCPFARGMYDCLLDPMIVCRYGATEIRVPLECPLREGAAIVSLNRPYMTILDPPDEQNIDGPEE